MRSLVDGLGGEEIGQTGSQPSDIWVTGSIITESHVFATGSIITAGNISGAGDIWATSGVFSNVGDVNGEVNSILLGSTTANVWGGVLQVGSFDTSAGSVGFVTLGTPFSSAAYYVVVTPAESGAGYEEGYISGVKHVSGVNFVGGESSRYDWMAVGLVTD